MRYLNVAFYRFAPLEDLPALQAALMSCVQAQEMAFGKIRGTILLASEGLNVSLSGESRALRRFVCFLQRLECLGAAPFDIKESWTGSLPFQRFLVRIKPEVIPGDHNPAGKRLTPAELKTWLDEDREFLLLDTRNQYEFDAGSFEKARHLNLRHFRHFEKAVGSLSPEEKERPMVMFCTGGIRCEKAAGMAARHGVKDIYQLEGGILRYLEQVGSAHYRGGCFVFDDRLVLGPDLSCDGAVQCLKCQTPYISSSSPAGCPLCVA